MTQQARNLLLDADSWIGPVKFLIRDRDSIFVPGFDEVFASIGVRIVLTQPQAPVAKSTRDYAAAPHHATALNQATLVSSDDRRESPLK